MAGRVLVLGATGNVGSALVAALARRGEEVAAATRRPGDGGAESRAVIRVKFDYDDPSTFAAALSGVDRVFLAVRPGDDEADRTAIPFIDAAKRAGVRRVVALTAMGVENLDGAALRIIERHLEQSGLAWTYLRPNFFMQIFAREPLVTGIRAAGVLCVPAGDAGVSFIDVRDIADVAAAALTASGHEGQAYMLTGPGALTHGEVAALLAGCTGRPIRYEPLDEDRARALLSGSGLPPARVERLLGFYRLVRSGWCSPVSPVVASVLGRPPRSMAAFVREHATVWTPIPPGV
jgi:uncharacterized protein YbjT (DUF2867 family)